MKKQYASHRATEISNRYVAGESIEDLATAIGVSITRIYQILKSSNTSLRPPQNYITDEEKSKIVDLYASGSTFSEIIKLTHRSSKTVESAIHGSDIDVQRTAMFNKSRGFRKYSLDETYFDSIDNERKAYVLGFISADGHITSRRGTHCLVIKLQARDSDILETIKAEINYDGPLYKSISKLNGKEYQQVTLQVSSVKLAEAIQKAGVPKRKSLVLEPWNGPSHLMKHYFRGLFDGDGCISIGSGDKPKKVWQMNFVGTETVVAAMAAYCKLISGTLASPHRQKNARCWQIHFGGNRSVSKLIHHFYSEATISLARKMALAQKIMLEHPLTPS